MDIPKALVQALIRGDVVLFVGAGLSIGAGLPGWSKLLTPLADEIDLPADRRDDLLQVAQDYVNAYNGNRQPLINHIRTYTDTAGIEPTANHVRLVHLGIRTWVTTNYDTLLEKTLDRAPVRCALNEERQLAKA